MNVLRTATTVIVVVALLVTAAPAAAQDGDPAWAENFYDKLVENTDTYNEHVDDVNLGPAKDRLAGKTVNVVVTDARERTGTASITFDERAHIESVSPDADDDADLRIETSRATIEDILDVDREDDVNPAAEFRAAYVGDGIRVEPNYSLVDAATGKKGSVVDWGFWTADDFVKGLFG